ncbi:MAG: 16S rRNA (guanine(966)-N(2))-methyltransferase RsmD [Gammaproteobacteria bacterium]|nr:MAG: 16S rRNA (guanine(966)-N(2))-methyltransferase RsmD [Gammaproteobacteria bacterium]
MGLNGSMKQGFVRIIAGQWRSRRLKVPDVKGLRPTPDRVRETVFNWLTPYLPGAYCLDLFAGSGALGVEALSRGAAYVVMVDYSLEVVRLLKEELAEWKAENAFVYRAKAPKGLKPPVQPFDIVFLDPPYNENILFPCCHFLETQGFLAPCAYIYLEARQLIRDNELPAHWRIIKSQQAGQVFYHLAQRELKQ